MTIGNNEDCDYFNKLCGQFNSPPYLLPYECAWYEWLTNSASHGDCIQAKSLPSLCSNLVVPGCSTIINFIRNKPFFGWEDLEEICQIDHNLAALCGITLWIIWFERNVKIFNRNEWHKSIAMYHTWDECIVKLNKHGSISPSSAEALVEGFHKT
jgi:hypothetical protein